ncbi:hypothetical protein V6N13_081692 [Hibiscus sabdariffa]
MAQPEVGSSGRKSPIRHVVSGAPLAALENTEERVKGSRQNGSVTSRKGLALRARHGGPSPELVGCRCTTRAAPAARAGHRVPTGGWTGNGSFGGLPHATNN